MYYHVGQKWSRL